MKLQMGLCISVILNVILLIALFFKSVINSLVVDFFKRRRDKKEREQRNLRRLKSVLEEFDRHNTTLIFKIFTDGFVLDEETKNLLNRGEESTKKLEEVLLDCPANVISKVEKFKREHVKVMDDIVTKKAKGGFLNKEYLALIFRKLEQNLNDVKKAVDKTLIR